MLCNISLLNGKTVYRNTLFYNAIFSIIFAIGSLMLTGFHNASDTPEQVVTNFYKLLDKHSLSSAINLIYIPSELPTFTEEIKKNMPTVFAVAYFYKMQEHKGLKNIKINNIEHSANKKQIKVSVTEEYNDGVKQTDNIDMIKIDDKWFISVPFDQLVIPH